MTQINSARNYINSSVNFVFSIIKTNARNIFFVDCLCFFSEFIFDRFSVANVKVWVNYNNIIVIKPFPVYLSLCHP